MKFYTIFNLVKKAQKLFSLLVCIQDQLISRYYEHICNLYRTITNFIHVQIHPHRYSFVRVCILWISRFLCARERQLLFVLPRAYEAFGLVWHMYYRQMSVQYRSWGKGAQQRSRKKNFEFFCILRKRNNQVTHPDFLRPFFILTQKT